MALLLSEILLEFMNVSNVWRLWTLDVVSLEVMNASYTPVIFGGYERWRLRFWGLWPWTFWMLPVSGADPDSLMYYNVHAVVAGRKWPRSEAAMTSGNRAWLSRWHFRESFCKRLRIIYIWQLMECSFTLFFIWTMGHRKWNTLRHIVRRNTSAVGHWQKMAKQYIKKKKSDVAFVHILETATYGTSSDGDDIRSTQQGTQYVWSSPHGGEGTPPPPLLRGGGVNML